MKTTRLQAVSQCERDCLKKIAASDMTLAATCQEAIKIFLQFLMGDLNPRKIRTCAPNIIQET